MYSKFQLSYSIKWLSYEHSNMPHLLVNTLYNMIEKTNYLLWHMYGQPDIVISWVLWYEVSQDWKVLLEITKCFAQLCTSEECKIGDQVGKWYSIWYS